MKHYYLFIQGKTHFVGVYVTFKNILHPRDAYYYTRVFFHLFFREHLYYITTTTT